MFNFIQNIETKDIPLIRAFFNGMSSAFTYAFLIWLSVISGFSWFIPIIAMFGVSSTVLFSLFEDKQTINKGEYKMSLTIPFFLFVNLFAFWALMFNLCFNMNITNSTLIIVFLAFIFVFIRTLASSFLLSPLMKSLKKTSDFYNSFMDNKISSFDVTKKIEEENEKMKKQIKKALLFSFFPSVLSIFFLWWAFFEILKEMNFPIYLVLYLIFAIILEIILSNFTKKLKKELINKVIENKNGQERD